ncbi:MAG: PASTA domain-containing protein [Clostridia bacterium]|nr:PASTA domain-containing protein [Clostridia bacterium]
MTENLCLGCMRDIGGAGTCPHCGWHRGEVQRAPYLPQGVDVGGRYVIGRKVSAGGDGTTYIAYDLDADRPVYVREFFADAIMSREDFQTDIHVLSGCETVFGDCRAEFLKLWDKLIKLRGLSSLLPTREVVSDYGTLYAVLEYHDCMTLDEYLYALPDRRMSWDMLRPVLLPLLSTVETLHTAGVIHGGISPETVLVAPDGRFYIGGFCILQARCAVADLNAMLYDGYAALEQYGMRQRPGTWTDVYALASVIYRCLTGQDPIAASQRAIRDDMVIAGDVAETLPRHVIDAVIDAFQTKPENRSADVQELRAGLLGQPFRKKVYPLSHYNYSEISYVNQDRKPYVSNTEYFRTGGVPAPDRRGQQAAEAAKRAAAPAPQESGIDGKKGMIAFLAVLAVIALGVGIYFIFFSGGSGRNSAVQTTAQQTEAVNRVPDLVGRTEVSVKSDPALRSQFNLVYVADYSVAAEQGYVFAQSLAAGTQASAGAELIVYVSLGPKIINIPDVVGIDGSQAKAQLEALGFVVQISEKANDGAGTQGIVASVTPEIGTALKQGDTVYLNVWGAPPATTVAESVHYYTSPDATVSEGGAGFLGGNMLPDLLSGLFG